MIHHKESWGNDFPTWGESNSVDVSFMAEKAARILNNLYIPIYKDLKLFYFLLFFFFTLMKHYVPGIYSFKLHNNPVWEVLPTTYRWAKWGQRHLAARPRLHLVNGKTRIWSQIPGFRVHTLNYPTFNSSSDILTRDRSLRKDSKPRKRIWKQKWNDQRKGMFPLNTNEGGKRR